MKTLQKRVVSILLTLAMCVSLLPVSALNAAAATWVSYPNVVITIPKANNAPTNTATVQRSSSNNTVVTTGTVSVTWSEEGSTATVDKFNLGKVYVATVSFTLASTYAMSSGAAVTVNGGLTTTDSYMVVSSEKSGGSATITITFAPTAPAAESFGVNSITLAGNEDFQYAYTAGSSTTPGASSWQDSATFSNLTPGTAYTFYMRKGETGKTSAGTTITLVNLNYNANGGNGSVASQGASKDSEVTVADGTDLTRAGYTFAGWNTDANGNGTTYAAGSSITLSQTTTTLYAQWELAAPEKDSETESSITLKAVEGIQYVISTSDAAPGADANWQDSVTFEGLDADTTYYFFAMNANGTISASAAFTTTAAAAEEQPGNAEEQPTDAEPTTADAGIDAVVVYGTVAIAVMLGSIFVVHEWENLPVHRISGTVADAAGNALPGATIELVKDGRVIRTVTAKADGSYKLYAAKGEYTLLVSYTDADGVQQTLTQSAAA
jgi:uncharacterized repeat protein (TIGR02543 family)